MNGPNGKQNVERLRDIKSNSIGALVSIKGIVTKASDVKPCIQVAVFACDVCGFEVYQVINSREFTPLVECPGSKCKQN